MHARQTIPGLFGTPGSSDNKSEPSAPTAKGRDFSVPEFVTCVRHGRGGMETLQPEDADGRPLKRLSDAELGRLFERIDTDKSGSMSFGEFWDFFEKNERDKMVRRAAARSRG